MINWPGSRGHPIPRVEVTDPGMDPQDQPRHGMQGSLANPRGTVAERPEETPQVLNPDRVVVRVPPPIPSRPAPVEGPNKKVTLGPTTVRTFDKDAGPSRNTRRQTRLRGLRETEAIRTQPVTGNATFATIPGGSFARAEMASLECIQQRWIIKLGTSCKLEEIKISPGQKDLIPTIC